MPFVDDYQDDDDKAILKDAKAFFKLYESGDGKQRSREIEDIRFYNGDQWDPDVRNSRAGQEAGAGSPGSPGLPPTPARPTLTINKLREPVRQVLNGERQSDMGVALAAADDWGDLEQSDDNKLEVELREGLVRRIQRSSEAADARTWAFQRAVIAGRGYYGVMTRYVKGKTFDKEVYVRRFYNQSSVYMDPSAEQPDGSDARKNLVGSDMSVDDFKATYPDGYRKLMRGVRGITGKSKDDLAALDLPPTDEEWRAFGDEAPTWFSESDPGKDGKKTKSLRVMEFWYTVTELTKILLGSDGDVYEDAKQVPDGVEIIDERYEPESVIKWAALCGCVVLEKTDWEGPDMPIVRVLGEELQPYDGEKRCEGMVRPSRDGQFSYNAMISKWVEMIGLAPIPPFQVTPEQVEGWKAWYQAANTRTLPFLPYNLQSTETGQPLGPPPRTPVGTDIAAVAASVNLFDQTIQATTGVNDPQLGKVDPSARSGRAIRFLQEQSTFGTSNYLDNLKRAVRYEGQIENNLLYPIYGKKPGRLLRIITGQDDSKAVQLAPPPAGAAPAGPDGAPQGQAQGPGLLQRLRAMLPGQGAPAGMPPIAPPQGPQKQYRLTPTAKHNVIVKVTRAFESRRVEEAQTIADLLSANPQLMAWFGDLFFKNQDGPGHEEMAERAKVMLAPPIQQMLAAKEQGQTYDAQTQAQLAQMKQQLDQAHQLLQKAKEEQDAKTADNQAKFQTEQMKQQFALLLQEMRDATSIAVAQITAAAKGAQSVTESRNELIALGLQHQHEENLQDAGLHADAAAATQQQGADAASQAAAQQADAQSQESAQRATSANQQSAQEAAAAQAGGPQGGGQ